MRPGWWQAGRSAALLAGAALLVSAGATRRAGWARDRDAVGLTQEARGLAARIAEALDGTVRFGFAARDGVCGDGRGHIDINHDRHGRSHEWCEPGPVWVEIERREGRPSDLDAWVGSPRPSRQPAGTDLGLVSTAEASGYLLGLARSAGSVAEEAVSAAALADSVEIWPELLALVRDEGAPGDAREVSIFWLSQLAGERASADLEAIAAEDGDSDVRQAALFGLSQLPDGSGLEPIMRVARSSPDAEVVQAAMFWLGQSRDPRAIAFFEEILSED